MGTDIHGVFQKYAERPAWTHVRCEWFSDLRRELADFFDEVKRLQRDHGRVRFVFGFDS